MCDPDFYSGDDENPYPNSRMEDPTFDVQGFDEFDMIGGAGDQEEEGAAADSGAAEGEAGDASVDMGADVDPVKAQAMAKAKEYARSQVLKKIKAAKAARAAAKKR
jgi:hypothetical protein